MQVAPGMLRIQFDYFYLPNLTYLTQDMLTARGEEVTAKTTTEVQADVTKNLGMEEGLNTTLREGFTISA